MRRGPFSLPESKSDDARITLGAIAALCQPTAPKRCFAGSSIMATCCLIIVMSLEIPILSARAALRNPLYVLPTPYAPPCCRARQTPCTTVSAYYYRRFASKLSSTRNPSREVDTKKGQQSKLLALILLRSIFERFSDRLEALRNVHEECTTVDVVTNTTE